MVDPKNVATGRNNKANGAAFELRVRKDLEDKGWIVSKWPNNIIDGKLCAAKHKWNGPGRPMALGTGFPDFIAFRLIWEVEDFNEQTRGGTIHNFEFENMPKMLYEIIGVESKINGYLDKVERLKCQWYLNNNVFSKILVASKTKVKNRIVIKYEDFEEKYGSN